MSGGGGGHFAERDSEVNWTASWDFAAWVTHRLYSSASQVAFSDTCCTAQ